MLEPSYLLDVSEEFSSLVRFAYNPNNNYYNNKILKSDWLSTSRDFSLNRTVRVMLK